MAAKLHDMDSVEDKTFSLSWSRRRRNVEIPFVEPGAISVYSLSSGFCGIFFVILKPPLLLLLLLLLLLPP